MTTKTKAITGVRSITHLYRGREGWTPLLYLISYEWIFLNNLLQLTNMKLFAALERALLARWRKIKVALKINKWPLLSLKEQRLQLKKQYLESLFRKKWQKFERSIHDTHRDGFPPWHSKYIRTAESRCVRRVQWVSAKQGRSGDESRESISVCCQVDSWDSQSCATHLQRVGTLKYHDSLRIILL